MYNKLNLAARLLLKSYVKPLFSCIAARYVEVIHEKHPEMERKHIKCLREGEEKQGKSADSGCFSAKNGK
jgi:hypothetical protein